MQDKNLPRLLKIDGTWHKGFSLLEMLLSVAIIGILAGLSAPVYGNLQIKNDLDVASTTTVQTLRRAQILSCASDGDSTWGLHIESGKIILFKGSTYSGRDTSYDEIFDMSNNITPSGISDVVYSKLLCEPQTTGTITLTTASDSENITINTKGMISY